jgi:PAS domain S-box-containing protein
MSWLSAIDWFIPERLREEDPDALDPGARSLRQMRLAVATHLGAAPVFAVTAALQLAFASATVAGLAAATAAGLLALPFAIRWTGSPLLATHSFPFWMTAFTLSVTGLTGGSMTGALLVAGLVPLGAVLLGGTGAGAVWTLLVCAGLATVGVLQGRGVTFPIQLPPELETASRFRAVILFTLGTFIVGAIYASLYRRALREAHEALERAETARMRRQESDTRFRALTDNASDIIAEWDQTGFIQYIGPQIERATGSPPEEFVNTHWLEHAGRIHAEDVESFSRGMERIAVSEEEIDVAFRFRHKNGEWRWFEMVLRPFRTADGEARVVSVGRDVSERREAETLRRLTRELEHTAAELAGSYRDLEEFTSMASRTLQSPLHQVLEASRRLGREGAPDEGDTDLGRLREAAARMQCVVDGLAALSQVSTAPIKPERLDAGACLDRALEALAPHVESSGGEIRRDPLPHLRADGALLTEIFRALLSNALRFCGDGPPQIRVTAELRQGRWILGVRDRGVGVPDGEDERLFKPFHTLEQGGPTAGSGIGLALCRKAVERHGGRIWVEPAPGRGAHFRFTVES